MAEPKAEERAHEERRRQTQNGRRWRGTGLQDLAVLQPRWWRGLRHALLQNRRRGLGGPSFFSREAFGSKGPTTSITPHDRSLSIRYLGDGPVAWLGYAFGQALTRLVTTDNPELVKAVILPASQAIEVTENIAKAPSFAGITSAHRADRLAALSKACFAPYHDARFWLGGWYPETLKLKHAPTQGGRLRIIEDEGSSRYSKSSPNMTYSIWRRAGRIYAVGSRTKSLWW